jgi:hypothetical protein
MIGTKTGTRKKVDGMNTMMIVLIVWSPQGKKSVQKYQYLQLLLPVFILE